MEVLTMFNNEMACKTAVTVGYESVAVSLDDGSKAIATGDTCIAVARGINSEAKASGMHCTAIATGSWGVARARGIGAHAIATGHCGKASAGEYGTITLSGFIGGVQQNVSFFVDNRAVKADQLYWLNDNGELKEAPENKE